MACKTAAEEVHRGCTHPRARKPPHAHASVSASARTSHANAPAPHARTHPAPHSTRAPVTLRSAPLPPPPLPSGPKLFPHAGVFRVARHTAVRGNHSAERGVADRSVQGLARGSAHPLPARAARQRGERAGGFVVATHATCGRRSGARESTHARHARTPTHMRELERALPLRPQAFSRHVRDGIEGAFWRLAWAGQGRCGRPCSAELWA